MRIPAANEVTSRPCTAFAGHRLLLAGPLVEVALAVKAANLRDGTQQVLVFDDESGRVIDLDLRGTRAEVIARLPTTVSRNLPRAPELPAANADTGPAAEKRGRGRPKLGVVPREVTLLPRHWDWLSAQPGGASVALRRLVENARRTSGPSQQLREARETVYRFMSAIAGDLPGFEEATRALFAGNELSFTSHTASWPQGIRDHAQKLAARGFVPAATEEG